MKVHEFGTTIEDRHLDMFGHVNNAAYLELFEKARWDLITRGGFGPDKVRESKTGPTLLEVTVRFRREIRGTGPVTIKTRTVSYKSKIGRLEQEMLWNGESACVAEFVIALFDLEARKLIRPTPEWKRAVGLED
ncbi:MAG: acyl-CoA thioesterase [Elusimicrobiota bacterium]|nr:MAG: acyl-CoA thioesterase [Elusimicrobiota bacterium]